MRHGPRNRNVCFINPDDVYGYDDNGELVGFSLGKLANLALNPIAQTRAALNMARGAGGALASAAGFGGGAAPRRMPPAPELRPQMAQAGAQAGSNTIHGYMGLGAPFVAILAALTGSLTSEPQSAFIGKRMILDAAFFGASADGRIVLINQALTVSGMPQTPAPNAIAPMSMFAANATYAAIDLQIATSATQITVGLLVTGTAALAAGDSVTVAGGLYGEWIR